ncbi:MAG: sulfotransferase, partial [Aestuariivirgaceae bacterium]
HLKASRFLDAAKECRAILDEAPDQPDALHFLGLAQWQIGGNAGECAALIKRAMKLVPGQSHMHHNLAAILASSGDLAEAERQYRHAIKLNPKYAEAYFNLSGAVRFSPDDPVIPGMRSLYAETDLTPRDRDFICYALSKAHDDTGNYEEAFHFALEGSRFKKLSFDIDAFERAIGELRQTATRKLLKPVSGRGNPSDAPIFIVGMPRSGTTLVEQVLSRHSDVYAGGELQSMGSFHRSMQAMAVQQLGYKGMDFGFWPLIPHDLINSAGAGFLQFIEGRAGSATARFTDKMPSNTLYLGLIAMTFPNARIIHVRRHPLDTCVSCFMQRFRDGQEFSYRLDWLGRYYRAYVSVMEHWRKVLPLQMLEIRYEDLVADPEAGARRLISFANLDWQAACADPSAGTRDVRTASRWQVRQPVYKTSIERWKRYQNYLEPLISALGGMDWINARHSP